MTGLLHKSTTFEEDFNGLQILAVADKSLIYLLTPVGVDYLNELRVLKISIEHTAEVLHKINLKKIWIKSDDDVVVTKNSLFSTLLALKKNYKCKFDFKINEQSDIALAVRLASGYIIKMFVIR